jgi:hypothetical protein
VRRWAATAAAGAAAVLALTGCGQNGPSWLRPGAALLYGQQRVSATALSAQVANLSAAYQATKARVQPQYRPAQMPALVLSWYLRFATMTEAEQLYLTGQHVTQAQAEQALGCLQGQLSQRGATLRDAAVASGLPPDLVNPQLGYWFAVRNKLLGISSCNQPASSAALRRLGTQECQAAKRLNIMVNPQYGAFDYNSMQVVLVPNALAAAPGAVPGGRASANPRLRLTPPC